MSTPLSSDRPTSKFIHDSNEYKESTRLEEPNELGKSRLRETLYNMFCDLKVLTISILDQAHLNSLGIRAEALPTAETTTNDTTSDNTPKPAEFFEPMSEAELQSYSFGPEDEVQQDISSIPMVLENIARRDGQDSADFFCALFARIFGATKASIPKTEQGSGQSLEDIRRWVFFREGFIKSIFKQHYLDTLFFKRNPPFSPAPSGDERLLRGEFLATVAATSSRMLFKHFKRHAIVSVMVLSFMDPTRGRILQAYHDDHELVLQKSKLFDFSSVKTAPFELFMRHLTCKPVGNTEQFPATSVTEVVEGDFVVLSSDVPCTGEARPGQGPTFSLPLRGTEWRVNLLPMHSSHLPQTESGDPIFLTGLA